MNTHTKKTESAGPSRAHAAKRISKQLFHNTKLRFIAVGLTNTAVDFAFFNLGILVFGLVPAFASIFSTSIAMMVSFLLNKKVVFKAEGKVLSRQLPSFLAVTIFTQWFVQAVVITGGVALLEAFFRAINYNDSIPSWLAPNAAKVAAIAIGAVTNYMLYSRWVFRKK
ncbi:MAG TPA: GtrA family protein [Candidatus Saccharimonadales bacterium]